MKITKKQVFIVAAITAAAWCVFLRPKKSENKPAKNRADAARKNALPVFDSMGAGDVSGMFE